MEQHAANLKKLLESKSYAELESYLMNKTIPKKYSTWREGLANTQHPALIFEAARQRDSQAVEVLIRHQADNYEIFKDKEILSEDVLFVAPFYNDENDSSFERRNLLVERSTACGSLAEIKYWHEERDLFRKLSKNPLVNACSSGYNDCVEYLVKNVGCDVDEEIRLGYQFSTPLKAALCSGKTDTADLLVKLGADPHKRILVQSREFEIALIQQSIVYHVVQVYYNSFDPQSMETIYQNRISGLKWALKQGINFMETTRKNCYDIDSDDNPSLIEACQNAIPDFAELILDHQRDMWADKGGPILEAIPEFRCYYENSHRPPPIRLIESLMPLINPEKKAEHLANALAIAVCNSDTELANYLESSIGADLKDRTNQDDYHYCHAMSFASRMKLSSGGVDLFVEENEAKQYQLMRVDIPTEKSVQIKTLRQLMNIEERNEIFFEWEAQNTDPEAATTWQKIKHKPIEKYQDWGDIILMDKYTSKVYYGPRIQEFVLVREFGDKMVSFQSNLLFAERFAVFAKVTPKHERYLALPKGLRIITRPISIEAAAIIEAEGNPKEERGGRTGYGITHGEWQTGITVRETRSAAKRKREQNENEQTTNKRRKTK